MKIQSKSRSPRVERLGSRNRQAGISLIEIMVSLLLVVIGIVSMLSLLMVGVMSGHRDNQVFTTVTTEAQNKLEELMALEFDDFTADTSVSPTSPGGGFGLCGVMAPNSSCGSIAKGVPVEGFRDYLDEYGQRLPDAAGAHFLRQWEIRADAGGGLKTIGVRATQMTGFGAGEPATAVVATVKADY